MTSGQFVSQHGYLLRVEYYPADAGDLSSENMAHGALRDFTQSIANHGLKNLGTPRELVRGLHGLNLRTKMRGSQPGDLDPDECEKLMQIGRLYRLCVTQATSPEQHFYFEPPNIRGGPKHSDLVARLPMNFERPAETLD